ncbi:hypothetical protein [Nakamurella flava]|uniref:hypothetical protein n=1 Tax=Nakamurella flava TaxID=2576308 RepID=UPI00140E90BB|nr:hypothetical protein [Nakamurella flava]
MPMTEYRTAPAPPRRFGTALLRTEIDGDDDHGYRWTRRPGAAAPEPFADPARSADPALLALTVPETRGAVRLALGAPDGTARWYRADAPAAAASLLLYTDRGHELAGELHGLGRLLRRLHDSGPASWLGPDPADADPAAAHRLPRGWRRLHHWLDGAAAIGDAPPARDRLVAVVGTDRWELLRRWTTDVARSPAVRCHGAPGLGSLVPGGAGGDPVLLTGEDLAVAPWTWDLGWVVGELVELSWQLGRSTGLPELLTALFTGYGQDLGPDWSRHAALRITLHVHDFSAYTHGSADILREYADFLAFLIDQSAGAAGRPEREQS